MLRRHPILLAVICILSLAAGTAAFLRWRRPAEAPSLEGTWNAVVITLAGDGTRGSGDGRGAAARFSDPFGIAVAPGGTFYVADSGDSHSVRAVSPDGTVTTIAGGNRGFADGAAGQARFDTPSGIAVDLDGTILVADTGNDAIRRITPTGDVTTLAGPHAGLRGPIGIAVDAHRRVLVADTYNDRIVAIGPDGAITNVAGGVAGFADGPADAALFDTPTGIAAAADGTLYVADLGNAAVRAISPAGDVTTLDGSGDAPVRPIGLAVDPSGSLFVADDRGRIIEQRDGAWRATAGTTSGFADGVGADARFRSSTAVAIAGPGRLVVTDRRNALVRMIAARSRLELRPPAAPLNPAFDRETVARAPLLWPFAPLEGPHEVTGTLGEPRGGSGSERFHAGLDIHSPEGTEVRTVRPGVVDHPASVAEFGSLNESVRIDPFAYVHVRVGRDYNDRPLVDDRFVATTDERGKAVRVRVRRGARFSAGEVIGTVNRFYHAHLNIGWPGEELNPLEFRLLGFDDTVAPTIRRGGIQLVGEDGQPLKAKIKGRLVVEGRVRIVVDAWDQVDGNEPRRRLGLFRLGYGLLTPDGREVEGFSVQETIRFDRHPLSATDARVIYAPGSGIPVYGNRRTRFLYVVTSTLRAGIASNGVFDATRVPAGDYTLRVLAADAHGNEAVLNRDLAIAIPSSGGLGHR